jgi:hypothetical protein
MRLRVFRYVLIGCAAVGILSGQQVTRSREAYSQAVADWNAGRLSIFFNREIEKAAAL